MNTKDLILEQQAREGTKSLDSREELQERERQHKAEKEHDSQSQDEYEHSA